MRPVAIGWAWCTAQDKVCATNAGSTGIEIAGIKIAGIKIAEIENQRRV